MMGSAPRKVYSPQKNWAAAPSADFGPDLGQVCGIVGGQLLENKYTAGGS